MVKKARAVIQVEVIVKPFRCYGITVKVDGSEDKEIHCKKDGGIAAEAFAEISECTAMLLASASELDDDDPLLMLLRLMLLSRMINSRKMK